MQRIKIITDYFTDKIDAANTHIYDDVVVHQYTEDVVKFHRNAKTKNLTDGVTPINVGLSHA